MDTTTVWIGIGVQLLLAAAAVWYTIETRALRMQNLAQMGLLKSQTRLSVAPVLVPGIVDMKAVRKKIAEDKSLTEEQRNEKLTQLDRAKQHILFVCAVSNPTTKIPQHCTLWIYDARTRSFLMSDHSVEVIEEKGETILQVSGPHYSRDEVLRQMTDRYGHEAQFADDHTSVVDESYILLLFRDLEGRVYLCKRPFKIDNDGDIGHHPSRMYFQGSSA